VGFSTAPLTKARPSDADWQLLLYLQHPRALAFDGVSVPELRQSWGQSWGILLNTPLMLMLMKKM
jgi:hypothetical protein